MKLDINNLTEVKQYVSAMITYLSNRFYLNNQWEYLIRVNSDDQSTNAGECLTEYTHGQAHINVNAYHHDTEEELDQTIIHEFAHIFLAEFRQFFFMTGPGEDDPTYDLVEAEYQEKCELMTRRLTRLINEQTNALAEFKKIWRKL